MTKHLLTISLLLLCAMAQSQELQCSVSVQSASVQGTNKQVYDNMRNTIQDFLQTQVWTTDHFDSKERIECSMTFNITEQITSNEFKGSLTVQLRRPVYGSAYVSTMLNVQDNDVQFRYNEGQPLAYNPSSYDADNLIPIIAFYANIMLGIDYDSFAPNGGTEFFKRAETIVSQAQSSQFGGWKSFEDTKNRYWLINNILDTNHKNFRQEVYNYHRKGLDQMSESPDKGRTTILESLEQIKRVKQRATRNAYAISLFFGAKADELVNIFSEAQALEKDKALEHLNAADPGNISKYQKIKQK